jgi:hypothetical protein
MKRRFSRTALAAIVVGGILAAAAAAATVGIVSQRLAIFSNPLTHATCTSATVSDDSYTDENSTASNFGTATTLSISSRSSKRKFAWIRFDLTPCSFPANAQVDSATLGVNVTTAGSGRTVSVSKVTATWSAGTITWANQPTASGTVTGTFSANATGAKTVDVSADAADFVDGQAPNYGWQLADLGTAANVTEAIGSVENTAGNRPTLTINYSY